MSLRGRVLVPPRLAPPSGPLAHHADELGWREVGDVARGRGEARMPELRLDQRQGHALAAEVVGERVSQSVRVHALGDVGACAELRHELAYVAGAEWPAAHRPADRAEQTSRLAAQLPLRVAVRECAWDRDPPALVQPC